MLQFQNVLAEVRLHLLGADALAIRNVLNYQRPSGAKKAFAIHLVAKAFIALRPLLGWTNYELTYSTWVVNKLSLIVKVRHTDA
jgi:hypothetical protein